MTTFDVLRRALHRIRMPRFKRQRAFNKQLSTWVMVAPDIAASDCFVNRLGYGPAGSFKWHRNQSSKTMDALRGSFVRIGPRPLTVVSVLVVVPSLAGVLGLRPVLVVSRRILGGSSVKSCFQRVVAATGTACTSGTCLGRSVWPDSKGDSLVTEASGIKLGIGGRIHGPLLPLATFASSTPLHTASPELGQAIPGCVPVTL
jgi:hypothetical protein